MYNSLPTLFQINLKQSTLRKDDSLMKSLQLNGFCFSYTSTSSNILYEEAEKKITSLITSVPHE